MSMVPEVNEPSKSNTPLFMVLASIVCSHRSRRLASPSWHLHNVWGSLMHATVSCAKICMFKGVVELVFVVFCYVEI